MFCLCMRRYFYKDRNLLWAINIGLYKYPGVSPNLYSEGALPFQNHRIAFIYGYSIYWKHCIIHCNQKLFANHRKLTSD